MYALFLFVVFASQSNGDDIAFEKAKARFRQAVLAAMEKEGKKARQAGDQAAVDQRKKDAEEFRNNGVVPDYVSENVVNDFHAAFLRRVKIYDDGIRRGLVAKDDAGAADLTSKRDTFKKENLNIIAAKTRIELCGKWELFYGSYKAVWTFKPDGSAVASKQLFNGKSHPDSAGSWTAEIEGVLVIWEPNKEKELLLYPIEKKTFGQQADRNRVKFHAFKLPD